MFKKVSIKPVELEYVQFTEENKDQIYNDVTEVQHNIYTSINGRGKPCIVIPTSGESLTCNIGDFIIKYPNPKDWCKFMCCSSVVFKSLMNVFGMEGCEL